MRRLALMLPLLASAPAFAQNGQQEAVSGNSPQGVTRRSRRDPQPRVRYELGPDSLPTDGVPEGKLLGPFLFHSKIIEGTVRQYWVYVPAQYNPDEPACVLVFQDGARAVNPNGVLRVPQVLENLIAKKEIPVTIGIFVTPGQRGDEFPDSIGTGNPNNRDREYDVLNDAYARFVIEELLPEVGRQYNLTSDPAGRAIGGSSSGGICAFTVAWERPDAFRNVISLIGSYTNIHGGHVYPRLVLQNEKKPIRIFLQDGVNDIRNPGDPDRDWHLQNQKMIAAFEEKGYDMAYVIGEGGHSDDHGGAILPHMLRWIWRDHPGVVPPKDDPVLAARDVQPVKIDLFPGFDRTAKVDPSGTWTWERRSRRGNRVYELRLSLKDGQVAGTLETRREDEDQESSQTVNIDAPELEGNKLAFDVSRQFNDRTFTVTYQGIVDGDRIAGWTLMDFGGNPRDFEWTASRVVKLADLLGSWVFQIEGPNGDTFESTLTLSRDGDNIKGVYDSQFFGEAEAKDVRVKDNQLTFAVTFERDGNEFTFQYAAKPRGDSLTGTITSEFGGETRETPFKGSRKPTE